MDTNVGQIRQRRSTLEDVLDQQSACWGRGERPLAEEFLERFPALHDAPDAALDVIYQELLLRRGLGERPKLEEYIRRFPFLSDHLTRQFAVDQMMQLSEETQELPRNSGDGTSQTHRGGSSSVTDGVGAPQTVLPRIFPGYDLLAVIGRGGMGVVYKAWDTRLGRVVAIKTITDVEAAGPNQLGRFLDEARVAARLQHPNIVTVHEIGEHEGRPYFALEFVDGLDLKKRLAEKPMSPRDAAELLETLSSAVHAAHKAGIVHRDLKPSNILLTAAGVPKVADFGLAKLLESDSGRTESGQVVGTPSYMAPEQAAGHSKDVGPAADIYALGAILYEALTGRPPFLGDTPIETVRLVCSAQPVSPRQLRPDIPRDLETICLKCLEKDIGRRYLDVLALAQDLRKFRAGEPILARPISDTERVWRWCLRNKRVASLSAAVAALLVIVLVGSVIAAVTLGRAYTTAEGKRKEAVAAARAANEQNRSLVEAQVEFLRLLDGNLRDAPAIRDEREHIIDKAIARLAAAATAMTDLRRVVEWPSEYEERNWLSLARAHQAQAKVSLRRNQIDDAMRHLEEMEAIVRKLAAANPTNRDLQVMLLRVQREVGHTYMYRVLDSKKAEPYFRKALAVSRALLKDKSDDDVHKSELANSLGLLAGAELTLGHLKEAGELYREEIEVRESFSQALKGGLDSRRELAGLYAQLATLHLRMGQRDEAHRRYDQSVALRKRIADERPGLWPAQNDLGLSYNQHASMLFPQGRDPAGARKLHQKALDVFKKRATADPSDFENKQVLAQTLYYEATCALHAGDKDGAAAGFRECLKICQALAVEPKAKQAKTLEMLARARCGDHAAAAKIADELLAKSPKDAELCVQAACGYSLAAAAAGSDADLVKRYTAKAIDCLREAKEEGWADVASLEVDTDLEPIRNESAFKSLLDEMRQSNAKPS